MAGGAAGVVPFPVPALAPAVLVLACAACAAPLLLACPALLLVDAPLAAAGAAVGAAEEDEAGGFEDVGAAFAAVPCLMTRWKLCGPVIGSCCGN